MKILMVCLGNICRSPLAEGLLRAKVDENIFVDSAGTGAWHVGQTPDPRSIQVARKYGIDISQQRARQFQVSDFDEFDLIYVMDDSNYEDVIKLAKNETHKSKVKLILSELPNSKFNNVPDPYYGKEDGFETVYKLLDEATQQIVSRLKAYETNKTISHS